MKFISAIAFILAVIGYSHNINGVGAARVKPAAAAFDQRQLLLNQEAAAQKVQEIVIQANKAVENGETSGVALPLDYSILNAEQGSEQQLSVKLRLPGVDRDLNIMIDTGSSTLAFCDKSLAEEADITKTNYAQCRQYDSPNSCPDGSSGYEVGWSGQLYQGDVTVGNEIASMDNITFAIMDLDQIYSCFGPLDGIIGVAYKGLNGNIVQLPSPDFDIMSLWNISCSNPNEDAAEYKTIGNCDIGNMTQLYLPPPLEKTLEKDDESGYTKDEAFGLYLNYAATIGSEVDTIVPSLGIFFGGNLAYNNEFYNKGRAHIAGTGACGTDNLYGIDDDKQFFQWYLLMFQAIRIPGLNMTHSTVDVCSTCGNCYTDSGNSLIELPLSAEQCDVILSNKELQSSKKSMFIDLTGADGRNNITISFPILWLAEQDDLGNVECTGNSGQFVLGLPIFQYYYVVYNMGNKTVTFVELQLSNETQTFIYGPELGGLANAGYHQTVTNCVLIFVLFALSW